MGDANEQTIRELRAVIAEIKGGVTGWSQVKPAWFESQDQMLDYMTMKPEGRVTMLEARVTALERGL